MTPTQISFSPTWYPRALYALKLTLRFSTSQLFSWTWVRDPVSIHETLEKVFCGDFWISFSFLIKRGRKCNPSFCLLLPKQRHDVWSCSSHYVTMRGWVWENSKKFSESQWPVPIITYTQVALSDLKLGFLSIAAEFIPKRYICY